ncbi:unnamed protein product [Brugia pahangi]|uniref:ZM domain-containing protein n=1 Tax=Brugia pahangi TaxID=6280 RepID=A0A0N4TRK4_BRUPA|nr:unnamed protein product [Brugia pahangi]
MNFIKITNCFLRPNSEAAEEQYKQQVGAGPDHALGANDRHFNPEVSETLKVIRAGENDTFGQHFNELIAQAEIPHIPPSQEPYWAHAARSRSERARSITPSATKPYYAPQYSTLQHPKKRNEERSIRRGYEFGGLDYVDRSRLSSYNSSPHIYHNDNDDTRRYHNEHKTIIPGYEMGGMDFRKGEISINGSYHGHGPEQRRLHSKFDHTLLKRDEMNIEIAPNVDHVSADVLIGDTRSNQHLTKNEQPDHHFGTSFGPTAGFIRQHRTVNRQEEITKPTTFSLSAKVDDHLPYRRNDNNKINDSYSISPTYHHRTFQPSTNFTGHTSQTVTNYSTNDIIGDKNIDIDRDNISFQKIEQQQQQQSWIRSHNTVPAERYEWANENAEKEVTIETLLNDKALIAQKKLMTPEWQSRSFEKHKHWKNRSDPRFTRSQMYDYEPMWTRIVNDRRNIWEKKARNTDARLQIPPSSKIPPEQPPHWYNRANQTHALWQNEADRQNREDGKYDGGNYNYTNYHREQHKYDKSTINDYDSFISQTHYTTHADNGDNGTKSVQQNHAQYHTSYLNNQQQQQYIEHGIPVKQSTHLTYSPVSIGSPHPISSSTQQQSSTWQSHSSSSRYEEKLHEYSTERMINNQPITLPVTNAVNRYAIEKPNYQRKTQHETAAPYNSVVSVMQGSGDFNRRVEMSEVLPRGTVANTEASLEGNYVDKDGQPVTYKREIVTSVNPNSESTLLKEEERRVVETPLEPGVISRHVTTKYYKKKTVTDTTTTNTTVH